MTVVQVRFSVLLGTGKLEFLQRFRVEQWANEEVRTGDGVSGLAIARNAMEPGGSFDVVPLKDKP